MTLPNQNLIDFIEKQNKHTVFAALGIKVLSYEPHSFSVGLKIDKRHMQHLGHVHGGIFVVLAESAASLAAAFFIDTSTFHVVGMEINANHLRSATQGNLRAISSNIYRGKTTHVYSINIYNDMSNNEERLVCVSRCTIAIRPNAFMVKQ